MKVITDSKELKKHIDKLKKEEFVTVDTEFMREKTYYPILCLIQISGSKTAFAIDTLIEDIDLSPLYDLLNNKKIIKVFHACQQDIEIFVNQTGKTPEPIFDTQVAAQILGFGDATSYSSLVEKICKTSLDKSSRRSDWSKRPLTTKQIDYAISDVTHLREVYTQFVKDLKKQDRYEWATEEMKKFLTPEDYIVDPSEAWKKIKTSSLSQKTLSIVQQIAIWRESYAQRIDKPRLWILRNEAMIEIADTAPQKIEDFDELRFFSGKNTAICEEILSVVKKGSKKKPLKDKDKKLLPKSLAPIVDLLKVVLKLQCHFHNITPTIVAKTEDLEKIAMDKKPKVQAMSGWRFEIFGKYAMALKEGNLALSTEGNKVILLEPNLDN